VLVFSRQSSLNDICGLFPSSDISVNTRKRMSPSRLPKMGITSMISSEPYATIDFWHRLFLPRYRALISRFVFHTSILNSIFSYSRIIRILECPSSQYFSSPFSSLRQTYSHLYRLCPSLYLSLHLSLSCLYSAPHLWFISIKSC